MHLRGQRSKGDIIEEYRDDMRRCLNNVVESLSVGARFVIVNAPAMVRKRLVDTNAFLVSDAERVGFELEDFVERPLWGPHFGMRASLATKEIELDESNRTKTEAIITLKRAS
jgi:hypothetical protein